MADAPRDLLGGHAAGNLSSEEQQELYAAALADQQLFDELVNEDVLREALEDPVVVQRLRSVLDEAPARRSRFSWFFTPEWMAAAALLVIAIALPVRSLLRDAPEPTPGLARTTQPSTPDQAPKPDPDQTAAVSPTPRPEPRPDVVTLAARVDRPVLDVDRFSVEPASKELSPLRRQTTLRLVPDRTGQAMVMGIDRAGRVEKLDPSGTVAWRSVQAGEPVLVTLPVGDDLAELRLVVVDDGVDAGDLDALLRSGRAAVYVIRLGDRR